MSFLAVRLCCTQRWYRIAWLLSARSVRERVEPAQAVDKTAALSTELRDSRATVSSSARATQPRHPARQAALAGGARSRPNPAQRGEIRLPERRGRDLNPRRTQRPVTVFETLPRTVRTALLKRTTAIGGRAARQSARQSLHADLVMLARLAQALSRARAVPLAA